MKDNEMLSANYKRACLNQTKRRLNDSINKFLEDENIDSNYKSKIIELIASLLALNSQ